MAVGGNGEVLLQCYNFGCGKTFNPETITDTSCCFHPGAPVFHDALKGWSCCRKRTTDFTEFMNIPGCTRGRCSNVKPEVPVKEVAEVMVPEVVNKPIEKPEVRPSIDEERKVMKIVTKSSYNQKKVDAKVVDVVSDEIKIGTTCFNKGLFVISFYSSKCFFIIDNVFNLFSISSISLIKFSFWPLFYRKYRVF